MTEIPKPSHLARLHILTVEEIQNLFELPNFTDEERLLYFSLSETEFELLAQFRSFASKLNFILQLGYFKARHLFFNFEFQTVSADAEFIRRRYFPQEKMKIRKLEKVVVNTILKHRRTIIELYNYQFCGQPEKKLIGQVAQNSAKISSKPIYIFREILNFLQTQRIILPGYSFLQDVISKALLAEVDRLQTLLKNKLTTAETEKLENLLADSVGFYEITNLKREPRDFGFSEIKREIERGARIKEIYQSAKEILPILEISNQSIAYYASLVSYYRLDKLKRFENWTTYLYLLCFIHQRYQRVQDNLINCLLYRIRLYTDQAKEFGKQKLSSINLTTNQNIAKAANVLKLLTDEQISSETPFGIVRQKAFEILGKAELEQFTELILEEIQLDEISFRWEYLDKIAHQFKMNLRPLLINVDFTGVADNSDLSKAIHFLRETFSNEQSLNNIISKKFPLEFIPEKNRTYLFQKSKKFKKKQIRHNRYEFFVYQSLANALDAGEMNCRESLKFRSFEDDLIDDKTWQQKDILLEKLSLPILSQPIELHLQELEEQLELKLKEVNQRIAKQENESFDTKGNRWSLKYPAQNESNTDSFFDSMTQIDLYQVLRFVHQQTDLLGSFSHLRGKYIKQNADETVISACLMAWGTNTGLGRMSQISDFKGDILQVASENFIRPETLQNANDHIVDEIAKFDLFHQYNINEAVHSSSDGQKFETRFHTINSRYSPKYFGLKKGIVAYTLITTLKRGKVKILLIEK